jgi:bifunctional DNase/RNase
VANSEPAYKLRALSEQKPQSEESLVEMVVEAVGMSQIDDQPEVILKEKEGEVYLLISIGFLEAIAISVILEGVEVPRPLTPDLLCSVIDRTGAVVERIVINDLQNNTFYASITLKTDRARIEVDARPSDAIAVALRTRVPVYVDKAVLDEAGIQPVPGTLATPSGT